MLIRALQRDFAACGITDRTFHNWMERGEREEEGPFFQFFQAATRARAKGKVKLVRLITNAAHKDWRAAAFLLERGFSEEFGRVAPRELPTISNGESPVQPAASVKIVLNHDGKQREIGFEEMQSLYKFPSDGIDGSHGNGVS